MLILPRGTYDLSIDDTVWSASTWVIHRIAGHVVVAETGAVVVAETGAVVVATECKYLLASNHMT